MPITAGRKQNDMGYTETLCWKCANAKANGCSWFTDYTPVAGWNAEPSKIRIQRGVKGEQGKFYDDYVDSYVVKDCPKFIRGRDG